MTNYVQMEVNARTLLHTYAGLDTSSPHGRDTPKRFLSMLSEITACTDCDGSCMKWKVFPSTADQMVVIKNIPFVSVCNHHVLAFSGVAHIGYIPNGKVAGLSKFARVVHHFARRLQVQEELTEQIGNFLLEKLDPEGLAVILQAEHTCMTIRGVQVPGTFTTTSIMKRAFADHSRTAKIEFLQHLNGALR